MHELKPDIIYIILTIQVLVSGNSEKKPEVSHGTLVNWDESTRYPAELASGSHLGLG